MSFWSRFGIYFNGWFVLWDAYLLGAGIRHDAPQSLTVFHAIVFGFQSAIMLWSYSLWTQSRELEKRRREMEAQIEEFDRRIAEMRRKAGL